MSALPTLMSRAGSATRLAVLYAAFAVVATLANLAAQRATLAAFGQGEAVAFGWVPQALEGLTQWIAGLSWEAGVAETMTPEAALAAAIAVGTGVGLVVKYVLDKRWIFRDRGGGVGAHAKRFGLYALMGVATTTIFWGAEALAWAIWGTHAAREAGAALGLGIGYMAKYQLDRRFVFVAEAPDAAPAPDAIGSDEPIGATDPDASAQDAVPEEPAARRAAAR